MSFEEIEVILLVTFLLCFGTVGAGTSPPGWSGPEGLGAPAAPFLLRLDFPPFPPPLPSPLPGPSGASCWPARASRTSAVGCFFNAFCLKQRVDDASMAQDDLFLMGLVDRSNTHLCCYMGLQLLGSPSNTNHKSTPPKNWKRCIFDTARTHDVLMLWPLTGNIWD